MKTDELVALLSTGVEPVESARADMRVLIAWAAGTIASLSLLAGVLRINSDLPRELSIMMFWVRGVFCASVTLVALMALGRLGRPGTRLGIVPWGLALPVLAMLALAAAELMNAPRPARIPLVLGHTAYACPWLISLLSAPLFITLIVAMRGLAPTRLRRAGAAAGLAAGASGALVYTLHCPELAAPFIVTWYVLGMLIPAALGAGLGPRLLRW